MVKSVPLIGAGPVVLIHTQDFGIELEKPTCVSCVTRRSDFSFARMWKSKPAVAASEDADAAYFDSGQPLHVDSSG